MATALNSTPALLDVQLPNLITDCWVPQGAVVQKKKTPKQSQKVCQCILLEPMLWLIKSEALTSQLVLYLSFHPFIYLSVGVSTSILNNSTTPPCALPLFIPSADEVAKLFSFSCTKCLLC